MSKIEIMLRKEWMFYLGDIKNGADPGLDDSEWRMVNLPHDWSIEQVFVRDRLEYWGNFMNYGDRIGYLPQGIGWYRKAIYFSKKEDGKKIFILFDGIYRNADIYMNGIHVGFHPYGYTPFYIDVTKCVKFGRQNILAVRVNNHGVSSRWYAGSGIYRDVKLIIKKEIYVDIWGVHVLTSVSSEKKAHVNVKVRIIKESHKTRSLKMENIIFDQETNKQVSFTSINLELATGENEINQDLIIEEPKRWSIDEPRLYKLITRLKDNDDVDLDTVETKFGIREIEFDPNKGFFLNGKNIKIKGVCMHHDNGCLGAKEYKKAVMRKLRILKNMGCNAIRTSHNPPSELFLDACDENGFLVMDEAFDEWKYYKTPWGYPSLYDEWHESDIKNQVLRDRNHPSVILWSIGNEIPEQKFAHGAEMCKHLVSIFHDLDPSRPVTSGCNLPVEANHHGFSDHLDVMGYNYFGDRVIASSDSGFTCEYDREHEKYPERKMIGSENCSALVTRGVYHFPVVRTRKQKKNMSYSFSAYDVTTEITLLILKTRPYVSGCFTWTGFDYLGEPSPYGWPCRSSNFGIVDLAGIPKDTYYLYKSQWTQAPMVRIVPHNWNWETSMKIPVWIYSNCEIVELFLNGKQIAKESMKEWEDDGLLHAEINVSYKPGELLAIGINGGARVAEDKIITSGEPRKIMMSVEDDEIIADEHDITFLKVQVVDANDVVVPTASSVVYFTVNGPGRVIGVDNGNPASHEPLVHDQIHAFNGYCIAVVQSMDAEGTVEIIASSPDLEPATIKIRAVKNK
ncbi:MAG: glycoside hydrolase family 2 TIM barrel-domain containing protein [Promethearchaeota archaeon]